MEDLSSLFFKALAVIFIAISPVALAQAPATNSGLPIPGCNEDVASVRMHTAVWHFDSKKFVLGLTPDKFRLMVDESILTLECFSEPDEPYAVGFVIDYSSSIHGNSGRFFVDAIREFVKLANEKNTYFGIGFKGKPFLMLEPTNERSEVETFLADAEKRDRSGSSSVNDALQMALETFPAENSRRRILILASDGDDTASKRRNESALGERLRNAGVRVFVAKVTRSYDPYMFEYGEGVERMFGFADDTSGGWLWGNLKTGLGPSFGRLAIRLRAEYALGFTPVKVKNKWQPLTYGVKVPKQLERVTITGAQRFFY